MKLNYCSIGKGDECIIMLPGMSLRSLMPLKDVIADAYSIFLEEYRIYLFDRREDNPVPYSIREMSEDTFRKIREIGIEKAIVFGASQGGMIAQCMAIDHPEFVTQLILASSMPRSNETSRRVIGNWADIAGEHKAVETELAFFNDVYKKEILDSNPEMLENAGKGITDADLDRFAVMARSCDNFDVYDELYLIRCPVYVLGGAKDSVLGVTGSRELAEKLKCESYIYEDYGHGVYDEAPDFRQRWYEFIKKHQRKQSF